MRGAGEAGRRSVADECRQQHAPDGGGRTRPRVPPARTRERRVRCWRPLQVLLDLGADLNAVDKNGETAMHARGLQEPSEGREVPRGEGRQDRHLESATTSSAGRRSPSPSATDSGISSRQPETEAAIREVMIAAGVTPPKVVVAKTQQIY